MTILSTNIILNINDRIDCGAYAHLFRPSEGALVYKLFIGAQHHTTVSQGLTDQVNDVDPHPGHHPFPRLVGPIGDIDGG